MLYKWSFSVCACVWFLSFSSVKPSYYCKYLRFTRSQRSEVSCSEICHQVYSFYCMPTFREFWFVQFDAMNYFSMSLVDISAPICQVRVKRVYACSKCQLSKMVILVDNTSSRVGFLLLTTLPELDSFSCFHFNHLSGGLVF